MSVKRILFIDDEEDIIALARFGLELQVGWKMIAAYDSTEGVLMAELEQPDAILLDLMMPKMDGLQTLAKLQANPKTKHIPAIFITAQAQPSDRRGFYAAGAKGVINKPFDCVTLASQISGFLGWR